MSEQLKPGWYPDPATGAPRWFDGEQWGPSAPATVASQSKTSGLAIASLVLGLVWIYGVGSILAIIFAVIAKKNIQESNGMVTGGGMATAGLVLGIIGVVGMVFVLAAVFAYE